MVFKSPYPDVDIPKSNILTYLFGPPASAAPSRDPLWYDARDPNTNLSPFHLLQWVRRLGSGLGRLGLGKDDVVMICTPNQIHVPVAYLGIVGAGCIFSGANPAYTEQELVHQITNTTAKLLLVHPKMLPLILPAARKAGVPKDRIFQFSETANEPSQGVLDWREMIGTPEQGDAWNWPDLPPQEATSTVATINYSSGTTGLPKGVCVSHYNLIANVEQTVFMRYAHKPYSFADRPLERWIGFLPLYHAYGQLYTILMAIKLQVPVYIMTEFRYEEFLEAIGRYKITSLQIAPPILVMLSKRPETARYDLRSVKDVLCGAAPLSRELQNECQRRFNVQINQGWGMTEVTCGAIHVPGGIKDDSGSVGQLDPNCECRLVDEDGKDVAKGQPGEMWVRGPNICLRYWRNEAATRDSLDSEGWLKTGDVAICDDKGFFWIVDRKKELIKVNALQVAPAELEAALLENDHIADAAVVGITLNNNEWPRAYVVIQESSKGNVSPKDIQDWMAKRVAKHKRLVGGVVFIDEVPKLASGKIQRKTMREWAKRDAASMQDVRARL
ncbi:4-coumarate-CoA ligase [Emericellopsis atlantica]|uniref:4-coumarate-CoA ligase n=1 Tax=Emericellopsis atlantica TaxID=2614577 RepID=A0A9P7ZVD5_9HYPO|nr:4-coumarate-CoA ligase [Emericellopsis atlantica]KAG9258348.1 4-coumarate-CoA ligase [Emericellopsis atlantica]